MKITEEKHEGTEQGHVFKLTGVGGERERSYPLNFTLRL